MDIVNIKIISLSAFPISCGLTFVVKNIVAPKINEAAAQNLMSRPVWFVSLVKQYKL